MPSPIFHTFPLRNAIRAFLHQIALTCAARKVLALCGQAENLIDHDLALHLARLPHNISLGQMLAVLQRPCRQDAGAGGLADGRQVAVARAFRVAHADYGNVVDERGDAGAGGEAGAMRKSADGHVRAVVVELSEGEGEESGNDTEELHFE